MTKVTRREFIQTGTAVVGAEGVGLTAASATPRTGPDSVGAPVVLAGDVRDHLLTIGHDWVDLAKTVDTFKCGGPETPVRGIAVGWMPYTWALRNRR